MLATTPQPLIQELEQIQAKLLHLSTGEQLNRSQNSTIQFDTSLTTQHLDALCKEFGLAESERQVLLLCLAMEMIPDFDQLCAHAQGQAKKNHPTLALAQRLSSSPDSCLLLPESALQKWQLIQINTGPALSHSAIRIDPAILSYILGYPCTDPYLASYLDLVPASDTNTPLPLSQQAIAAHLLRTWKQNSHHPVQLTRSDIRTRTEIALHASTQYQHQLYKIHHLSLPTQPDLLNALILRWQRHTRLTPSVLLLECGDLDTDNPNTKAQLSQFIERLQRPVILSTETRLRLNSPSTVHEISPMTIGEQRQLWMHYLGESLTQPLTESFHDHLNQIATNFKLTPHNIEVIAQTTLAQLQTPEDLPSKLWKNCRNQTRSQLESFAQRIDAKATWNDLVLSTAVIQKLEEIISQMRHRHTVYEDWELAGNSRRGLGITALFFGASGTGKTTSAEIIAHELGLDLYRVDLSKIVSKYIGETEKHLAAIFADAESTGAILQFDEADALIGKRSDVKDARDRYANMEVSYLLQRMESYSGLAILTTNLPNAMDSAFQRRIRVSIRFEVPDQDQRAEIWRRILSNSKLPTEGLSVSLLSQINMSGAILQNIARIAAFKAAEDKTPIRPHHILAAASGEALKIGRSLMSDELYGWPRVA
jgi:ATPase family associated with various cellular activities (AAA)